MRLHKKKQQHKEGAGLPAPVLSSPAALRVRMLRQAFTAWGFMEPGRVVRVPVDVGKYWIAEGIAEQDKSLDGPPETK